MYSVIIDSKAGRDLEDIIIYITETLKAPDAARNLYHKIKHEILNLELMPYRCPLIAEPPYSQIGVRKLFVENYIAFFVVDEAAHEVHIFRILYNHREWHDLL